MSKTDILSEITDLQAELDSPVYDEFDMRNHYEEQWSLVMEDPEFLDQEAYFGVIELSKTNDKSPGSLYQYMKTRKRIHDLWKKVGN